MVRIIGLACALVAIVNTAIAERPSAIEERVRVWGHGQDPNLLH